MVRSQFSENCMISPRKNTVTVKNVLIELFQEAQIAFIKQSQVIDAVTQHGQSFQT